MTTSLSDARDLHDQSLSAIRAQLEDVCRAFSVRGRVSLCLVRLCCGCCCGCCSCGYCSVGVSVCVCLRVGVQVRRIRKVRTVSLQMSIHVQFSSSSQCCECGQTFQQLYKRHRWQQCGTQGSHPPTSPEVCPAVLVSVCFFFDLSQDIPAFLRQDQAHFIPSGTRPAQDRPSEKKCA